MHTLEHTQHIAYSCERDNFAAIFIIHFVVVVASFIFGWIKNVFNGFHCISYSISCCFAPVRWLCVVCMSDAGSHFVPFLH